MSEKRPRITRRWSKQDPSYWRERLFKNEYAYKGERAKVRSWSVKLQLFGKRKSFTLGSHERAKAAEEACQLYRAIIEQGWGAVSRSRAGAGLRGRILSGSPISSPSLRDDAEYWKGRLIHRKYPEPDESHGDREFSIWIEHARTSQYFPLGTSDENEAAARAMRIYRAVITKGWASANARFPRELTLALRWRDNPLAWTYTTVHTRLGSGPLKPGSGRAVPEADLSVVIIEPDAPIRFALEACINSQEGFRCDASFASAAEALHEISRRRVDLALANHDLPDEPSAVRAEELQRARPGFSVLSYSVFEDSDQLFKSTPGGAAVYMLKRTSPGRILEPIAGLARPATREQIASRVREYFRELSALLPSGPPFWKLAKLTPREHEILVFLSKGDLVKEIADALGISNWTVHGHVKSIFEKLKVHTRTEAVIRYLQK
ncbi:MAG TPA: response regulator transcription factor [Candidatus Acidoferrum sp.]|nr:response regulator transcription factor [Candidatus Acidoferrum sp.]